MRYADPLQTVAIRLVFVRTHIGISTVESHTLYFTLTMMANTLGVRAGPQCCGK